jgi:hypothetical protein
MIFCYHRERPEKAAEDVGAKVDHDAENDL